ncbi:MAG: diaminopimelate decarboxylase [Melioribacteraceae bacterium]|nr:diaminopimelate decarboxylase [Melioribacteraceae bacterium]
MLLLNSDVFTYKNNELYCEEIKVSDLTSKLGTPLFIYSKKFFRDRFLKYQKAFEEINHTIFFATKSNFNLNVMKIFYDLGAGIDVNSAGELFRALKIGADPKRLILTGVGKTKDEIKMGLENDVLLIKAESPAEIYTINKIAEELNVKARVAIRVNPNVDPQTHPYITTGLVQSKFGIPAKEAIELYIEASKMKNIQLTGIDMHIGSQITKVSPFVDSVKKLAEVYFELKELGIELDHFDIGGGMGVVYKDENPFAIEELAENLIPIFKELNCEIMFEPGRYLTANGGILATEVIYTKSNNEKNFIVVDGAMTDVLRPSIYGAYHNIQPAKIKGANDIVADIVGPVCETGDFLAKDREIQKSESGDVLAVMTAGAYGMVMSSNYNARRRPPEIVVDKNKFYVTRSRETYEHLLYDENIINELHD